MKIFSFWRHPTLSSELYGVSHPRPRRVHVYLLSSSRHPDTLSRSWFIRPYIARGGGTVEQRMGRSMGSQGSLPNIRSIRSLLRPTSGMWLFWTGCPPRISSQSENFRRTVLESYKARMCSLVLCRILKEISARKCKCQFQVATTISREGLLQSDCPRITAGHLDYNPLMLRNLPRSNKMYMCWISSAAVKISAQG